MIFPKTITTESGSLPAKTQQFMILKSTDACNILITDAEASKQFIESSYRAAVYSSFYHDYKKADLKLKGDLSKTGNIFLKKDSEIVMESFQEKLKKLPLLVDKLFNQYCRVEVYFIVDTTEKLNIMKQNVIEKIESLQFVGVQANVVKNYFNNYIQNLNYYKKIELILFVLYYNLLNTLSSDTRISTKSLQSSSPSIISFINFENYCFEKSFYELFNISKFHQILFTIFSDGLKQKDVILFFLIKYYSKYTFKIEISKNIIGKYLKKFIDKNTVQLDPAISEKKEVDLKDFLEKIRSKTRLVVRKAILNFALENINNSFTFLVEVVKNRVTKLNGFNYMYSTTPYEGELLGKFNYILQYCNSNNYSDVKSNNDNSEIFDNIKRYFFEYVGQFVNQYYFKGGFADQPIRELLLRLIFFETEYQNTLYRGPNLFLKIFSQQATAAKYFFNFMALNWCAIVGKGFQEKVLGRRLYKFKENFFRYIRREQSSYDTYHFLKGLHIYSLSRNNILYYDQWEKFQTVIYLVKEVEDNRSTTLSESDQDFESDSNFLYSDEFSDSSESAYSLHDSSNSDMSGSLEATDPIKYLTPMESFKIFENDLSSLKKSTGKEAWINCFVFF